VVHVRDTAPEAERFLAAAGITNAVAPEPPPKIVPNVPVSPEAMALANMESNAKIPMSCAR